MVLYVVLLVAGLALAIRFASTPRRREALGLVMVDDLFSRRRASR